MVSFLRQVGQPGLGLAKQNLTFVVVDRGTLWNRITDLMNMCRATVGGGQCVTKVSVGISLMLLVGMGSSLF